RVGPHEDVLEEERRAHAERRVGGEEDRVRDDGAVELRDEGLEVRARAEAVLDEARRVRVVRAGKVLELRERAHEHDDRRRVLATRFTDRDAAHARNAGMTRSAKSLAGSRVSRPKNSIT